MTGIIAPSMMTMDIENIQASTDNYKIISFPNRVRITDVSFTVNAAASGTIEDARVWNLYAMLGSSNNNPLEPWSDFTYPIFGGSEKPILDNAVSRFVSTSMRPASEQITVSENNGTNLTLDGGILKPGDYLTIWIEDSSGDFADIVWEDTKAIITISYEGTAAPTLHETLIKYPTLW